MTSSSVRAPGVGLARRDTVVVPAVVATVPLPVPGRPKLLPALRERMRLAHLSPRSIDAYADWVRRYVRFCGMRHPAECGEAEVRAFLSDLAVRGGVSASTQNQARAALIYLYRNLLDAPLPWLEGVVAAKGAHRVRVVLERDEVRAVIGAMRGKARLAAMLMYGGGLRLSEVLALRVHDLDFGAGHILVRGGKGNKDRHTVLPASVAEAARRYLDRVRVRWQGDRAHVPPVAVRLPDALARKYRSAEGEWGWYWVLPAGRATWDGARWWRYHLHPSALQRAVREAVRSAGIAKSASCHSFRHSFATHTLQDGYDVRTVQELLGHASLATTQTYLHVMNRRIGVRSPLDGLKL